MKNNSKFSILTKKDILILEKLLIDGRASSASISKEIDLGREIVNYRIKRLIKENLIIKFVPKISEIKTNYKEYIILLKLNLEDDLSKEEFVKTSFGNKYLVWIIKSKCGWDLIVRLYASSIEEFKEKLNEILEGYSNVLAKYYTIISSDEIKESQKQTFVKTIFEKDIHKKDFSIIKKSDILKLDDKNKEIIKYLEQDARIQYKEIAKNLNVSSDTIKYRIDKMKEQGVIENFEPIINFNKIGFTQYAGIVKFLFLTKSEEILINDFIKNCNCILKAIKNLNSEEYFLTFIFKDKDEYKNLEKQFYNNFKDKIDSFEIFKID